MYKILVLIFCIILSSCKAQRKTQNFEFKSIGWTVSFPKNAYSSIKKIKDADTSFVDKYATKVLLHLQHEKDNSFTATLDKLDSTRFTNWEEAFLESKKNVLQYILAAQPNYRIVDSLSSFETIGSVQFRKFYFRTLNTITQDYHNTYWFSGWKHNFQIGVTISFTDDNIGKIYIDQLTNSVFK